MTVHDRRLPALTGSLAVHLLAAAALMSMAARAALSPTPAESNAPHPLVWLSQLGPGGGGGGGGNHDPRPPRAAHTRGDDAATVDATRSRPATPTPSSTPIENKPERIVAPIVSVASGIDNLPGAIAAPPTPTTSSFGPGGGGGAGRGEGTGDGPGDGGGIGPGWGAGIGDGPYRPGADVTMPVEIRKGTPQYTTDAMRARAQGAITVECIVQPIGVCTNIRVKHAFEPAFGLDQEAIKAAGEWRFRPGTRRGQPVPVLVTLEIAFVLR